MISQDKADFIRSLADADGHVDPDVVVAAAQDPRCILHDEFSWDLEEAAKQCWRDRAQALIRYVKLEIRISRQTIVAPFYVCDPIRPPKSRRYVELTIAGRDRDIAQQILTAELDRIVAAVRRAQQIAAVLGLQDELESLLEQVSSLKTAAEVKREEKKKAKATKSPKKKRSPGRPEVRA